MSRVAVLIAVMAAALTAAVPSDAQDAGRVHVRFISLQPEGRVTVALFADEASWRRREGAAQTLVRSVAGDGAEAVFENLRPGRYAIMAYHDRNADGRLNTLPVGLPTEPYGFSNDARGPFGTPPSWRPASFEVTAAGAAQTIRLR